MPAGRRIVAILLIFSIDGKPKVFALGPSRNIRCDSFDGERAGAWRRRRRAEFLALVAALTTALLGGSAQAQMTRDETSPAARNGEAKPLPGREGARSAGYWAGTPYTLIVEALRRLPVRHSSPVLRRLALEILMTAPDAGDHAARFRLSQLRAERLLAMGQLAAAEAALKSAPQPAGDALAATLDIEIALLLRGREAGCSALARHMAALRTWSLERGEIACQALAGEHAKAAHGLGQLRERGWPTDDAFSGLITSQQSELAQPLAWLGPRPDAWVIQLLTATRLPWPADAALLGAPALLRAVALSRKEPFGARLAAADRAFLLGALDHAELAALYNEPRFRSVELTGAGQLTTTRYGAIGRALLFQAAQRAPGEAERLAVLDHWWRLARSSGDEVLTARASVPLISGLAPGSQWRERALEISRNLFHAGAVDDAVAWSRVLHREAVKEGTAFVRLAALAHLAGLGSPEWSAEQERAWLAFREEHARSETDRRFVVFAALRRSLGERSARRADFAMGPGTGAEFDGPESWRAVRNAARAGRRGEVLLLMLVALGDAGLGRAEPFALGEAVAALSALGMADEARRLSVETALANGL